MGVLLKHVLEDGVGKGLLGARAGRTTAGTAGAAAVMSTVGCGNQVAGTGNGDLGGSLKRKDISQCPFALFLSLTWLVRTVA